MKTHLSDTHSLDKKRRALLLQKYGSLPLRRPKDVRLPQPGGLPFQSLGQPLDALLCHDCTHITTSKDGMQKHCKDHDWWFSKDDPKHWTEVKVQTFFGHIYQRYFIVASEEKSRESSADEDEDAAIRDQLLREFDDLDTQDQKRLEIADSKTEKSDNTGWWNFVQWRPHFGSRNIRRIAHASRLPDRNDKQLQRASEIVSMMIKRAVDGLSSLHDDTPYWLRTANSTEKVENRPMVRLQNEDSLDRYITYLRRFACYLLRVYIAQKEMEVNCNSEVDSGEEESLQDNEDNAEDESEDDAGDETQQTAHSEPVDPMKDCCELTKFSPEQKERLEDMIESLESDEDDDTQIQKMSALILCDLFLISILS